MEPVRFEEFPSTFLYAPLRKDILHRAVIFEGDAHRLGRAKTKDRGEVRGSSRKLRPQKGTGKARLGDKKSPMLRGGGVAHGPKPRDFSTELPRQIYDLAWRTAISYRYRRAELIVVENSLEITSPDPSLAKTIMTRYGWGKEGGRSLFITTETRPNLEAAMEKLTTDGRVLTMKDVDVKDLVRFDGSLIPVYLLTNSARERTSDYRERCFICVQQAPCCSRGSSLQGQVRRCAGGCSASLRG